MRKLRVTLIDTSHKDRPALNLMAEEIISDATGTVILSPWMHPAYATLDDPAVPSSIAGLARDCAQGFDLNLSHDWVVKVHA